MELQSNLLSKLSNITSNDTVLTDVVWRQKFHYLFMN